MTNTPLTLGLLPPLNGGLQALAQAGQQDRLIEHYFRAYARSFVRVFYFSYFPEQLEQYTGEAELLAAIKLLPGRPGRRYTFRLPFRWAGELRQCQVLRVFQLTGVIPAAMARVRWRTPFAVTYGYDYARFARAEGQRRRALVLWLLEQLGLRIANAVIVTTPALRQHVSRFIPANRVYLIPNTVDTARFAPAPHLPPGCHLLFVGRLERQKNLFMLLDALEQMANKPRLVVVGDGSQRAELLAAAARRGIDLEWHGVLPHESLPGVLRQASAFVLPSLIEGQPKALLEAMSCGLPCVGLNVAGTRDVIRHEETGLLAPPTAAALAAALARLMDDPGLAHRLGRAARRWVESRFSPQQVIQQEIELLCQLGEAKIG
ncbi:MAG: glycosyltransferase family 4 protein [Chloroflexi bacterium]|nr:glycosyltransferase family 4 protein [Chloroflexota bacterium]MCI0574644.1 glycosyltransferase family 4 protein [Chloroflexota bacterium]MCI0649074.1 glycosyltransferase family 4 protein [Chloroflexota bacterium]MCI0730529.1 glycosyltransferase family 4 protein [Chloroflexota bacterium]